MIPKVDDCFAILLLGSRPAYSAPQPSFFRYQHQVRETFRLNDLGDTY
jgi:hypothetical protein